MQVSLSRPRRVVLSYGIFDGVSPDQTRFLQQLSRLGDEVIIGCATDIRCAAMGIRPRMAFEDRRALLARCRYVDRVIAEVSDLQKRTDIVNYNVSVFAMDAAWAGAFDDLEDIAQITYLPQTAPERLGLTTKVQVFEAVG